MLNILNKIRKIPRSIIPLSDKELLRMGFCHHKCGTSYLRRVFNGICKNTNYNFNLVKTLSNEEEFKKIVNLYAISPNNFLFFENGHYKNQIIQPKLKNYRGFHIVRDPRDVIVSGYFSHKYSHPTAGEWGQEYLVEYRKWLNQVSEQEGLHEEIKKGYALNKMAEWRYDDPNIFEIKFENLIANPFDTFTQILNFIKIDINPKALKKIIERNSFENITKGRKPGEEDVTHHFRKGVPGDWKNHFTNEYIKLFKEKWGNLLIKLDYEKDNNW